MCLYWLNLLKEYNIDNDVKSENFCKLNQEFRKLPYIDLLRVLTDFPCSCGETK